MILCLAHPLSLSFALSYAPGFAIAPPNFGIGVATQLTLTDSGSTIETGTTLVKFVTSSGNCANDDDLVTGESGGGGAVSGGAASATRTVTLSPPGELTGIKVCIKLNGGAAWAQTDTLTVAAKSATAHHVPLNPCVQSRSCMRGAILYPRRPRRRSHALSARPCCRALSCGVAVQIPMSAIQATTVSSKVLRR